MNPTSPNSNIATDGFSHAMRREIYEQPRAIANTIERALRACLV
jgi:glucosamine 6-phosphate synthetase-like amidotransferase/phosphosugar isomerase protein